MLAIMPSWLSDLSRADSSCHSHALGTSELIHRMVDALAPHQASVGSVTTGWSIDLMSRSARSMRLPCCCMSSLNIAGVVIG